MIKFAMEIAINNTTYPRWRFGAVLTKGSRVFSFGASKKRNNPMNVPDGVKCAEHAEQAALRKARKSDLRGATIHVARVNNSGKPMMARPCKICESALREAGVTKMIYTTSDGVKQERILNNPEERK